MTRRFVAALLLGIAAISVGGCSPPVKDLRLGESDNGHAFRLAVSGRITLTLPSNVTTGYRWELATLDKAILENTGHEYVKGESKLAGAGGVERWEFAGRKAGTTRVRLEYRRPWEAKSVAAERTFEATVEVAGVRP
jgi:inhibitor of cysteine peptidase